MTTLDRICLLVAYYPPAAESGARRPYNLVRELRAAGFSVDVLVAAPGETAPVTGDHGETIVHVVPHRPRSRSLWQRILRRVRIKWLRTFVSEFDPAVDVRRPLRRLLDATLSRRDAILYVSAPPAGLAAMAVHAARRHRPGQRVVLEFRDPWNAATVGPRLGWLRRRYEQRRIATLQQADGIVAVTDGIAARMTEHGSRRPPVVAINGIPDELLERPATAPRRPDRALRMLYLGEFYLSRDPTACFSALARLQQHAAEATGMVHLDLVGEVEDTPGGPLVDLLAAHGLLETTHRSARVGYDRARELLAEADLFFLLAQQQPRQVPNKLYEYLAFRRPIFTIADPDGATARLLRVTGHAETLVYPTSSPDEIERALARAIALARSDQQVGDPAAIAALASSRQFNAVTDFLRTMAHEPGRDPGEAR